MKSALIYIILGLFLHACAGTDQARDSVTQPPPDIPVEDVYLYADERDLELLYSRDARADERIDGYVRMGDSRRIQGLRGGFRFRGNTSRYHPKKSFNIRFIQPQSLLFGGYHLNLNALYTDASGIREKLAWDMFHELGRPASKTRYMALHINDSYEGLGLHVQRVDELLLAQSGLDPRGTLVRDMTRRRGAALGLERGSVFGHDISRESDPAGFLGSVFNSRWAPDYAALAELLAWVHDTPAGAEFEAGFSERFDRDVFIDWLAIHYIIGDVDAFGDDYWLYKGREEDSKWVITPWDNDLSFGKNERDGLTPDVELGQYGDGLVQLNDFFAYEYEIDDAGWDNALISKFLASPGLEKMLHERITYLKHHVFTPEWFRERIDAQASVVAPFLEEAPDFDPSFSYNERQHHGLSGRFGYHKENVMDFIKLRYAFLDRRLNPVEGAAYTASKSAETEQMTYQFTDAQGWTLAELYAERISGTPHIAIRSEAHADVENGIQRRWSIQTQGGSVEGRLHVYYRNDIAPDGKENWYYTPEAVGGQWELSIRQDERWLETDVNPFSNKASAGVRLEGENIIMLKKR